MKQLIKKTLQNNLCQVVNFVIDNVLGLRCLPGGASKAVCADSTMASQLMEQTTAAPIVQDEPVYKRKSVVPDSSSSDTGGIVASTQSISTHTISSCRFCMAQSNFASNPSSQVRLAKTMVDIRVNGVPLKALVDTGSCASYIDHEVACQLQLSLAPSQEVVHLASVASVKSRGTTVVRLELDNHQYNNFHFGVLPNMCANIIIGHDLLMQHRNLIVNFAGPRADLILQQLDSGNLISDNTLAMATTEPPSLFSNLTDDCRPIRCASRIFSEPDKEFIHSEVLKLIKEGKIEHSQSPWRAQVIVATNPNSNKKRLVVDYSRTINKFTLQDAYPLPNLDQLALEVSRYKYYSTFDLRSAYHQIPIPESDRQFTAFEADKQLFQFTVIPFGVTNGPPGFQRVIDRHIAEADLNATYAYMDDITVCGMTREEHDVNVQQFCDMLKLQNLELNPDKSVIGVTEIQMLGYHISHGVLRPDPDRMEPLVKLPIPNDQKSLKRALGLFSYYSKWIPNFSDKVRYLTTDVTFPLSQGAVSSFESLKKAIADAALVCPNRHDLLVVETDASDTALSGSLNQNGRPVAFFSRTLQPHERRHPSCEKEAAAIVESCRKWRHYLTGRRFKLLTDQQPVSYIFDTKKKGKTKNDKLMRWRIELSCFNFDIQYRPGVENVTADCLSRALYCSAAHTRSYNELVELHEGLCHPGIARLGHFVRVRNLPYSMEDVKAITARCRTCAELKPNFYKPKNPPLIKSTMPFERLSIDFKGPLPSCTQNKYILTVVDEYSRFPFAFPCKNMESSTVIACLTSLFSMFGLAGYIHSDNGPSLISQELRSFLLTLGIGCSNSAPYNPRGNGQVERFNGTIWKSVQLGLRSSDLKGSQWEIMLPSALHSIRTLVCVSTNQTPHERLFNFQRRTVTGHSLPSWLVQKGSALLRKHVRKSKYDDLCEEVEIVNVNPTYAQVKLQSGREQTVSLRDLAPLPPVQTENNTNNELVSLQGHRNVVPPAFIPEPTATTTIPSPGGTDTPVAVSSSKTITAPPAVAITSDSLPEMRRSNRVRNQTVFYESENFLNS